jgi:UPF0755 protein
MNDRKDKRAKPRRRNGFIEILNGFLTLLVLALLLVGGLFFFGITRFYADGPTKDQTTFLVERGNGLGTIADRLEQQGLVDNRFIFQFGSLALRKEKAIKAGEYEIAAGSSMADILKEITEGTPIQYGVTVPEGFTAWQVISRVNEDDRLTGEITSVPVEGSILPGTYNYDRGDTRQSVVDRMQEALKTSLAEVWANRARDLPVTTPEELVILASVIEKETGVASERDQVAAVFVNRLKKGMRLQSDPTIIYGITKGQSILGRGLKRSEIEEKTPYNTYQIDGLPPTPIANPGIESLRAAANPAKNNNLYFVAAGPVPSDGHLFAATYDEHRRNVAKWRAIEREQSQQTGAEAAAAKDAIEAEQAKEAADAPASAPKQ